MNRKEALLELEKLAAVISKQPAKTAIRTAIDTFEIYDDLGQVVKALYIQEVEGEWMVKKR